MFLLFTGDDYYPAKGWGDFKGSFDTEAEAIKAAANLGDDWWQVVELGGYLVNDVDFVGCMGIIIAESNDD